MTTGSNSRTLAAEGPGSSAGIAAEVLDSLPGGVLVVGPDLAIRYRNAAATARIPDGTDVDKAFEGARFLDPFDGWATEIARVMHSGGTVRFGCAWQPPGASQAELFILRCTPLATNQTQGAAGIVLYIEDGSEWAGMEQRLAVAERLAAIGKLAAKVAHELNNPLDGILRYINLALRVVEDTSEEKLQSYLGESRTGLMRMVQIIGELLEFSRSTQGEFDFVQINETVEQAIHALASEADAHAVVVAADFQDQNMPAVRGGRLYQVCCNLIKNAIDAMPNGGRLTISTGVIDEEVVIRVADTGVGLPSPPEQVFEPFFTTKHPGKGTGLGLAICKDFVESMQGVLQAANGASGGAVFTIRLPMASCQPV